MRRPRCAVRAEPGQRPVALDELRVGIEDVGHLAVQAHAHVLAQLGTPLAEPRGRAHDELEVREVVGVVGPEHQEAALGIVVGPAVEPVAAVEHEDLERRHAVLDGEHLHLLEVEALDGRQVVGVIAPVPVLGGLQDVGEEVAPRAAAVQVVLAGPEIGQHRGHAAHRGGFRFGHGIVGQWRIDADVRVGVHEARKGEEAPAVEDFARVARRDLRCHEREAAVLDAEVEALDRELPRPHDADVLHDQIERRHTIAMASISMR